MIFFWILLGELALWRVFGSYRHHSCHCCWKSYVTRFTVSITTVRPQIVSAKAVQNPYFLWGDYADVGQLLSCKHCKQSNFRYFRSATEVVAPLHRRIWNTWRRRLLEVAVGWSAVVLFFEDRQIAIGLVSNWSVFGVDPGKYTHLSWFQYYLSIFQWIYT